MSKKPREPKRKRLAAVEPPKPLIQVMPGGRCRLDPSVIRELTAWVLAYSDRYSRRARQTLRGLKGDERKRALGERKTAMASIILLYTFAAGLMDTIDVRLIDKALAEWDQIAKPDAGGPDTLPFVTPPIPGTR